MSSVAETLFRAVAGDAGWEALPQTVKEELTDKSPAILADERDGYLDVTAEQLGTIVQQTLLVAAKDSPPEFAEVTNLMAQALPSARVEWVEGGHLINPAHPTVLSFIDEMLASGRNPRLSGPEESPSGFASLRGADGGYGSRRAMRWSPARLTPHAPDGWPVVGKAAFIQDLEPAPLVELAAAWGRGLEVGGHAVGVAALQHGPRRSWASAPSLHVPGGIHIAAPIRRSAT